MKVDAIREKVLYSVVAAEVAKGHLKWKVSDIARAAGVSRPLIYYHFGKTKLAILEECLAVIADEYYGLGADRQATLAEQPLPEALERTRKIILKHPALGIFYLKWRSQESKVGAQLASIEKRFQKKLKLAYPHLAPAEIGALHALLHGLITAPFLTPQEFRTGARWIESLLAPKRPHRP